MFRRIRHPEGSRQSARLNPKGSQVVQGRSLPQLYCPGLRARFRGSHRLWFENYDGFNISILSPSPYHALMKRLLLFLLLAAGPALAYEARVVGVTDGDTLRVLKDRTQIRIRIFGIDAPERGQPFCTQSKKRLSQIVFRKTVKVEFKEKDKYGRSVAVVLLDGRDIGLQMIAEGYAWWYERYARTEYAYARAERKAREAGLGLWGVPDPIPPWKWRHPELQGEGSRE